MGIDITSKIIAGLHYEELLEHISREELDELIDQGNIEELSPYYDAPRDQCAFGFAIVDGNYFAATELDESNILQKITAALSHFKQITGTDGKVLFGAHVY